MLGATPKGQFWGAFALIAILSVIGCGGCGARQAPDAGAQARPTKTSVQTALEAINEPGLVMGTFRLPAGAAADGDTISVVGVDETLRLLGIDTEETFKSKADRHAANTNFARYLQQNRGNSKRPRKAATPMGEKAKVFAKEFFKEVPKVQLERDHPREIKGRYGRYLAYVFAHKNGQWVNYNVECVRAGMSPYFMKYGYSRRFHDEFVQAEQEARSARRGIWSPTTRSYRDYPERKAWWTARADFIRRFRSDPNAVFLGQSDALGRIQASVGKVVTVVATVEGIQQFGGLRKVMLSQKRFQGFPVIFFDAAVYEASGVSDYVSEWIAVSGKVSEYRRGSRRDLQVIVDAPHQVILPALPAPGWNVRTTPE